MVTQLTISCAVGAGTRSPRHLLRIAGITFVVELHIRISLQLAIYFSMVRRNACWASFDNRSTSVRMTTNEKAKENNKCQEF